MRKNSSTSSLSGLTAAEVASAPAARFRAQMSLAEVSYTFWYELRLLHTRLGEDLGAAHSDLRRAERALRTARIAQRLGRGRWAMRRLESARRALLRAAAQGDAPRADLLGHLRALPHVWRSVTGAR